MQGAVRGGKSIFPRGDAGAFGKAHGWSEGTPECSGLPLAIQPEATYLNFPSGVYWPVAGHGTGALAVAGNPLKLKKVHHIELWVGNARQAAFFYRKGFGFSQSAYRGLETGNRCETSYVLTQGRAALVLTTPMDASQPASDHLRKHGDGVRDIALQVEDADAAFEDAVRRGAEPAEEPHDIEDEHGAVRRAAVHTYGDTIHSLISYKNYSGPFLPGYASAPRPGNDAGLLRIDHVVGNVELGKMEQWADFYSRVFGFHRFISFDDKDISTEYSALMSIVMSDDSDSVKFPINEPAPGRKKSQIDEYLEAYGGPGVQHIAFQCKDAIESVGKL
ncbi:MAG: VOC family protein, partial [Acidobacteriota bacterium]|nr:VOC family protein [Acidobacteriota bacterium]